MSPIAYTALIIAVAVVLFVTNKVPVVLVAMGTALSLWATGVLTLPQALGGLGDPAVIFIASLFIAFTCLGLLSKFYWVALVASIVAVLVLLRWSWENGAHPLAASGQGLDSFTVSMPRLPHRPLLWRLSPR